MTEPVDAEREAMDCLYRMAIALESINRQLLHIVQTLNRLEYAEYGEEVER